MSDDVKISWNPALLFVDFSLVWTYAALPLMSRGHILRTDGVRFVSYASQVNSKAAESLADPDEYPNLFEDWQIALNVEATVAPKRFWFIYIVKAMLL